MVTSLANTVFASLLLTLILSVTAQTVPKVTFQRAYSNYPKKVFEAQGSILGDNHLVVMGGFYNFPAVTKDVYRRKLTSATSNWQKMASMPEPLTHMAQMVSGNTFCGVGGFLNQHPGKSVNSAWCYDMASNKWTRIPNLPGDRAGGGLALNRKNGKNELIFAGGVDREFNSLRKHTDFGTTWTLDLNKQQAGWKNTGASMPNPRNHMGAVETCGRFFWVGGQHKEEETHGNQRTVSEYIPEKNQWHNVAPLPKPLGHISASVMAYKCGILVVAGVTSDRKRSNDVFWYSASADMWHFIGRYPVAAATPVCGVSGDKVMCATAGPHHQRDQVYVGTLN